VQKNSGNIYHFSNNRRRNFLYVWIVAVIGIIFFIPAVPKLIPAQVQLKISMNKVVVIYIMQLIVFSTIFAAAGAYVTPKIGFGSYLASISFKKNIHWVLLKNQFYSGISTGLAGAIIAYLIAPDFIDYLDNIPFLSRLFGGLTEEVIMRWGLMTIIVWVLWHIIQHGRGLPKELLVYSCIVMSQILFSFGHIPALINFGITNPIWSVITIFIVSLPWGWLFWKQGLESAFVAHASFHAFVAFFVALKL
jgi:hypothetical protein